MVVTAAFFKATCASSHGRAHILRECRQKGSSPTCGCASRLLKTAAATHDQGHNKEAPLTAMYDVNCFSSGVSFFAVEGHNRTWT